MTENTDNTLTAYLGVEFQQRLMWQLLVEPEFAEKIISDLAIEYFDDSNLRRLFIIILEYYKEFDKVPNLQNQSIHQAINKYKIPNNLIEEESLFAVIKRITLWNERIVNKQMLYDGDVVQKSAHAFVKQQEYRKISEHIQDKVKTGGIKDKNVIAAIEDRFQKIAHIGEDDDDSESLTEGIRKALRKEFRETIPTGIETIDELTGGGLGKQEIGVILTPSGVGKAQPLSSKILTPNGWVNMGEIKIGSEVIGSDGNPQKVLGVYPQGVREIYKVSFNDGTSTLCDNEHLWAVNSRNNRTNNTTITVDGKRKHIKVPNFEYNLLTLNEIRKNYKVKSGLNYRIPVFGGVEFNDKQLPVDPYLLGVLIGDGSLSDGGVRFTSVDKELINDISNIVTSNYERLSLKQVSDTITYSITGKAGRKNELFQQIKEWGLNVTSEHKFIPQDYKTTSVEQRISILQGLMDTDGYASKIGRLQFTTTSKQLSEDLRELVLSLGGFCRVKEKIPKYKYLNEVKNGKLSFILTISFSDSEIKPFRLSRKQERVIYRDKYKNNKYISSISYSHDEEAQCIYVENDDHLYVTDDYILTHNTTALTIIANTAYEQEKNVAQIIFEDTKDQIKRKHFVIWAKSALSRLNEDEENERVFKVADAKAKAMEGRGRLIIKRFSQEDTTMKDVRNWMLGYQKKWGFKFDLLVLDYLDCLESHKSRQDRTESELTIIKGFESLSADFDIPAWTAIQSNRSGFGAEFVEAHQSGGSIKRIQKAHFFMSVAKTPAQQEANFANIRIIKARFAKDGQAFEDCVFNNDTMQIIIDDPRYRHTKTYKNLKHHDDQDIDKLEKKATGLSQMHVAISEKTLVQKVNDDSINDGRTEGQRINDMLHQNNQPEVNDDIKPNDGFEATSDERKMEMPDKVELHPDVENIHISTSRTDLSQEELNGVAKIVNEVMEESQSNGVTEEILELDGEVTYAPIEEASEGASEGANTDLLDFSGDTTTETVGEPQEIPTPEERKELDKGWEELRDSGLDKPFEPPKVVEELKSLNKDTDEILRLIQETNPDAPEGKDKEFQNMLVKKRDYQNVKPKEKK